MPVASPCTGICTLDVQGRYCLGCWRSTDEIAAWPRMNDGQRLTVLAIVARRCEEGNRLAGKEAPRD
ncbi:DUF1289 domain-containing protein [Azovibrio restrictus]|uniref:DUF1289 domain-containing protein n=1 Tax=Azovibrio restrictus TaxID=146938 RepID=UPI0026EAC4D2|nr:DUF1289 domain-containing protein [Azovibrio restrictus]